MLAQETCRVSAVQPSQSHVRWTELTTNPNSREAQACRRHLLQQAWQAPVKNRNAYLASLARGSRVLDVGVADHFVEGMDSRPFLHRDIAQAAKYCLGVDIVEDAVHAMQHHGYNVRVCDITSDDVGEKFDLMVVGEVIEHLGSPEGLFQAANRVLVPSGRIVLTTPNPYFIRHVLNAFRGRLDVNVDHVTWFTPHGIAELAERCGLSLVSYRGVLFDDSRSWLRRVQMAIGKRLLLPDSLSYTYIYECEVPDRGW